MLGRAGLGACGLRWAAAPATGGGDGGAQAACTRFVRIAASGGSFAAVGARRAAESTIPSIVRAAEEGAMWTLHRARTLVAADRDAGMRWNHRQQLVSRVSQAISVARTPRALVARNLLDEHVERFFQLRESTRAEDLSALALGLERLRFDDVLEPPTLVGQSHEARAAVRRIGLAQEIAALLEVADELVDGLLGNLHALGDVGEPAAVEARITEQADVRRVHVVVPRTRGRREVLLPHPLPHDAHRVADVRRRRLGIARQLARRPARWLPRPLARQLM